MHSIYFEVLGEHGCVGLFLFLLLLGLTWLKCSAIIRMAKNTPELDLGARPGGDDPGQHGGLHVGRRLPGPGLFRLHLSPGGGRRGRSTIIVASASQHCASACAGSAAPGARIFVCRCACRPPDARAREDVAAPGGAACRTSPPRARAAGGGRCCCWPWRSGCTPMPSCSGFDRSSPQVGRWTRSLYVEATRPQSADFGQQPCRQRLRPGRTCSRPSACRCRAAHSTWVCRGPTRGCWPVSSSALTRGQLRPGWHAARRALARREPSSRRSTHSARRSSSLGPAQMWVDGQFHDAFRAASGSTAIAQPSPAARTGRRSNASSQARTAMSTRSAAAQPGMRGTAPASAACRTCRGSVAAGSGSGGAAVRRQPRAALAPAGPAGCAWRAGGGRLPAPAATRRDVSLATPGGGVLPSRSSSNCSGAAFL